jgi:phosphatidylserine/phosphatidylglycerophosphate/cardiolipin synthase-like enzyme
MRKSATTDGLTVRAIAGNHTVLLGMNLARRQGCVGFGIQRTDHTEGETYWLRGLKTFASIVPSPAPGQSFPLNVHPVQGFQWGDYTAKPGHRYTYRVMALGGVPGDLKVRKEVAVTITTEGGDDGVHSVYFNRGVAASQAYVRQFGDPPPPGTPYDDPRMVWLSRGLAESFFDFLNEATGPGWAIRGAFYEFTWAAGLEALRAAHLRHADVDVVVHGRDTDTAASGNDDRTAEYNRIAAEKARILGLVRWRQALNKGALQHNKFLVLLHDGSPVAVWTGSANLTEGGLYGHSNVAHVIRDPATAQAFVDYWDQLAADATTAELRVWTDTQNPITVTALPQGHSTVFSPRPTQSTLLGDYADLFDGAKSSAHITGAFGLNKVFVTKLGTNKGIPRTVLLDKPSSAIPTSDDDVRISSGGRIDRDDLGQWAVEHLTGFNSHVLYVHTKIIMIDPLSRDPIIATGSANYSDASTTDNEENTVWIRGDRRVADIYLTEYHRLFMHFVFRRWSQTTTDLPRPLTEDDSWSTPYYRNGSWQQRQRKLFAGT